MFTLNIKLQTSLFFFTPNYSAYTVTQIVFSCSHMQVTLCQDIFVLNVPTKVIFRFQFGSLKVKWRMEDVINKKCDLFQIPH